MSDAQTRIPPPARWIRLHHWAGVLLVFAAGSGTALGQVRSNRIKVPEGLKESKIIQTLQDLREDISITRNVRLVSIWGFADALVERFPNSTFRVEAQLFRLSALSGLAATDAYYITSLREATESIACETPDGRLAAENAFFAIQAFVYGARQESMAKEKLLAGTKERYEAFLDDYPESPRVRMIMGSLVRNAIRRKKIDESKKWVDRMKLAYPADMTTKRVAGELNRTLAINKPFTLDCKGSAGPAIKTADHKGKVVVVQLWTAWTPKGVSSLNPMAALYKQVGPAKLQLLSLNLDRNPSQAEILIEQKKLPWPQSFDKRGLESEIALDYGILRVPVCFVIDQTGVLRFVSEPDQITEQVAGLIGK